MDKKIYFFLRRFSSPLNFTSQLTLTHSHNSSNALCIFCLFCCCCCRLLIIHILGTPLRDNLEFSILPKDTLIYLTVKQKKAKHLLVSASKSFSSSCRYTEFYHQMFDCWLKRTVKWQTWAWGKSYERFPPSWLSNKIKY